MEHTRQFGCKQHDTLLQKHSVNYLCSCHQLYPRVNHYASLYPLHLPSLQRVVTQKRFAIPSPMVEAVGWVLFLHINQGAHIKLSTFYSALDPLMYRFKGSRENALRFCLPSPQQVDIVTFLNGRTLCISPLNKKVPRNPLLFLYSSLKR